LLSFSKELFKRHGRYVWVDRSGVGEVLIAVGQAHHASERLGQVFAGLAQAQAGCGVTELGGVMGSGLCGCRQGLERGFAQDGLLDAASAYAALDAVSKHAEHRGHEKRTLGGVQLVVKHDAGHGQGRICGCEQTAIGNCLGVSVSVGQEADFRISGKDFESAGAQSAGQQPRCGHRGDPGVALALHFEKHHGTQHQRYGCKHLIADIKQGP
jgi:hypothetical protein